MRTVAVGTRWDAAGVPLPGLRPMPGRGSMGGELVPGGDLVVDPARDPLVAEVADRAGEQRWLAAQQARYEERLAATYLRGAGELASRSRGRSDSERREWGARAMLAELATALRLPETTLARRLTRTTMLEAFPRLREAAQAGRISSWHVDVVLDVFAGVTDPELLARADGALVDRAMRDTAPLLRAAAHRWRARHVPRTEERRRAALAERRVEVTPADEDMMWLSALVPAVAGIAIDHRLDEIASRVAEAGDPRAKAQARADVLVGLLLDPEALCGTGCPTGAVSAEESDGTTASDAPVPWDAAGRAVPGWVRAVRPDVVVTVPVLSLLGRSDEPAVLEGFGPIDPETARQLCANAPSFTRVLTHPETGAVLSVGRDRYRIPADLRRAVRVRDVTCRFPGCTRRACRCDVDHSTAWEDGGATALCNLACLCRKHHRLKHEMGWQIAQSPDGALTWRSALGNEYRTEPGNLWPPAPRPRNDRPSEDAPGQSPGQGPPAQTDPTTTSSRYPDEPPF